MSNREQMKEARDKLVLQITRIFEVKRLKDFESFLKSLGIACGSIDGVRNLSIKEILEINAKLLKLQQTTSPVGE